MKSASITLHGLLALMLFIGTAGATTTLSYLGELQEANRPADGNYDFTLSLWDSVEGGTQVGKTLRLDNIPVESGRFQLTLNFGAEAFSPGSKWLQLSINGIELESRQPLHAVPYAVQTRGIYVDQEERVGVGITAPRYKLEVAGRIFSSGEAGGLVGAFNPDNPASAIQMGWLSNVARIRVGGNGFGAENGLDIQGPGDRSLLRIYGNGNLTGGRSIFENDYDTGAAVHGLASGPGSIGIYGSGPSYDFYAAGSGVNYGASSSRRWKRDIGAIEDPLELIKGLRGVRFRWDEDHGGQEDIGFIAEEVGELLPEIVSYEENGIDATGLDYGKITPLLLEAIKALEARVVRLEAQLSRKSSR